MGITNPASSRWFYCQIQKSRTQMKTLKFTALLIGLISIFSCMRTEKNIQPFLKGKVYISSEGVDDNCNIIQEGTDYYQVFLFLNDHEFVQICYSCCPEPGDDFVYEQACKGTYKTDDKYLALTFDQTSVSCHVILKDDEKNDAKADTEYLEVTKSKVTTIKLERLNCKELQYFKQTGGDYAEYITPSQDTLENYKKELVKVGAWKKLFPEK